MQAPLKKVSGAKPSVRPAEQAKDAADEASAERGAPAGGSAYVEPHSYGGASLVKDAREAAFKIRSLLG